MIAGSVSPLILIAGQGLMQNTGLGTNPEFANNLSTYLNSKPLPNWSTAISSGNRNNRMERFAADTCPALTNAIPDGYESLDPEVEQVLASDGSTVLVAAQQAGNDRMTALINTQIANILGNGDYSKFAIHFYTAQSYVSSVGELIDNVNTINDYLGATFDDMDALITGNITGISLAVNEFGTDLGNTGTFINLGNLKNFGTPQAIVEQFIELNLLNFISPELITQGINPDGLVSKIVLNDSDLTLVAQKKCYEAFKQVTGDKLDIIKQIFGIQNDLIVTLADTLNPFKMFPLSRNTLTSPVKTGYKAIYTNSTGSVNGLFAGMGKAYYSVMPRDICDANAALRRSFQQVKGIDSVETPAFAYIVKELETGYGLSDINALTQPLPDDTYTYYTTSFASGTGDDGRYYLTDVIGTPTGIHHNDLFASVNTTLEELDNAGALDDINDAFEILANWVTGVYGTPDSSTSISIPGYGSYTDYDSGIDAILDDVETMITTLTTNYPTQVASMNSAFDAMALAIQTERSHQLASGIDFEDTPESESSVLSLVSNLHGYATDDELHGPGEVLEKIANTGTRAGQALVGALREGRNLARLANIGVTADAIPETVTQPTESAELSTSQYSLTEALDSVILD